MGNKEDRPIGIRRFISLFNDVFHYDEHSKETFFYRTLVKMDSASDIYSFLRNKYKNVIELLDALVIRFAEENEKHIAALDRSGKFLDYHPNTCKNQRKNESMLVRDNCEFYANLGDILYEFGILESLVSRSNKGFSSVGAPFLSVNLERAREEFDKSKNSRTTDPVICMKLVFYINKIVKYIDDIEYGLMLERDSARSKIGGNKRLRYISKLKTDYLKKIVEADESVGKKEQPTEFGIQEEYERLFGEFFTDLDLEADLELVKHLEIEKDIFYISKGGILNGVLLNLSSTPPNKTMDRDITAWGIARDENGNYIFGMNLFSYPMPLTAHFQAPLFQRALRSLKTNVPGSFRLIIPQYKSLRTDDGSIFTTNLLFATNEVQRKKIRAAYSENPRNDALAFFYNQIKGRATQQRNEGYHISDLLEEK